MRTSSPCNLTNFLHVFTPRLLRHGFLLGALASLAISTGCQIEPTGRQSEASKQKSEALTLREGDVIKITIPGVSNLDSVQTIRRDGKVALALIGEVQAAGLRPIELQAELIRLYASQIVSKEINVSVVSSNFVTFVSGAVLRPGKVTSERSLTVLEAIMEAGGPDFAKANLKSVKVIRQDEDGRTHNFIINIKSVMDGQQKEPFFLKPNDIVIVPERFAIL